MKKSVFIAIILMILLCICAYAETVISGTCNDDISYSLDENGVLTVSGQGEIPNYNLTGDWRNQVTTAPWGAFREQVTSVVVDEGITSIGVYAFAGMTSMRSLTLPDSL